MTGLFNSSSAANGRWNLGRLWKRVTGIPEPKDILPAPPELGLTTAITPDREFLRRFAGSKEAALELARNFIKSVPCTCIDQPCPQCGQPLQPVEPEGDVRPEEFEAAKAGDYYCQSCKGDEANSGFKYFWRRDLASTPKKQCRRCHTLELTAIPGSVLLVLEMEWVKVGEYWRDAAETGYAELGQAADALRLGTRFCRHVGAISWKPNEPNTQEWYEELWNLGVAFQSALENSKAQEVWESRPDALKKAEAAVQQHG